MTHEVPVESAGGQSFFAGSGNVEIRPAENALFNLSGRFDVRLTAVDAEGRACRAEVESTKAETAGPVRSALCVAGSLHSDAGERLLGFRLWISVFAGLPKVMLQPMRLVCPLIPG